MLAMPPVKFTTTILKVRIAAVKTTNWAVYTASISVWQPPVRLARVFEFFKHHGMVCLTNLNNGLCCSSSL